MGPFSVNGLVGCTLVEGESDYVTPKHFLIGSGVVIMENVLDVVYIKEHACK